MIYHVTLLLWRLCRKQCSSIRTAASTSSMCATCPAPFRKPVRFWSKSVAAGINPSEAVIRSGALADQFAATFPSGQGSDLAGVVAELGSGVSDFAVGDEVIGFSMRRSSQAEYVTVPASQLTASRRRRCRFDRGSTRPTRPRRGTVRTHRRPAGFLRWWIRRHGGRGPQSAARQGRHHRRFRCRGAVRGHVGWWCGYSQARTATYCRARA